MHERGYELLERERPEAMGRVALDTVVERRSQAQLIEYGQISALEWPGSVSASKMIENGDTTEEIIAEAIRRLNEFYVTVSPKAKTRCIDGRHDPALDEKNLGPQVPGGAPGAALAYRLGVEKGSLIRGTFLADAEAMINNFIRMGFAPGGHRDAHSDGETAVGCGAIDGMDKVLSTMTDPKLVDDHKRIVEQLMGPLFDRDQYLRVMGAAVVVNGRSDDYFRGREAVINALEKRSSNSIATLEGVHQECLVVVNLVPGTTLASNRFANTFGGMQAFGYDLWRSLQMAGKLMPRPDETRDRELFVMARVMSTVATLMALTDGSQRFVLRSPAD